MPESCYAGVNWCLQVVLDGQKVLTSRAQQQGFSFRYTEVGDALRSILK